jgi:RHH-type rel operon transcriptional repressor/antitoxin RelB
MLELQLTQEIESMLKEQATKLGQTKEEFARRAILEHLEDLEDYEMGIAALRESQGEPLIPLDSISIFVDEKEQ